MLTYWCNARCAFCYVCGGPEHGLWMDPERAVGLWRGLDRLAAAAGKTMRIHLTGGEPFGDWSRLVRIIRAARDVGLTLVEKVETNAFWATDDGSTRARLELLDALGVGKLVVSTDVFHQQFVPFDRVRRCVEIARRVLGRGRVMVRWWDFFRQAPGGEALSDTTDRTAAFYRSLAAHRERLTGRAAAQLAPGLPTSPAAAFCGQNCRTEILHSRHIHIDPYGNVFPGTCAGIILGRVADDSDVERLWRRLGDQWKRHPVLEAVVSGGSYGLLQRVVPLGYRQLPAGYANKCHLCWHIRQFLVREGQWTDLVGPPECYDLAGHPAD